MMLQYLKNYKSIISIVIFLLSIAVGVGQLKDQLSENNHQIYVTHQQETEQLKDLKDYIKQYLDALTFQIRANQVSIAEMKKRFLITVII